jgi:RNA polymerase sigma-70 factor, ECF subfamily
VSAAAALQTANHADLVRRVAAGDGSAEAELCRRFAPRVRLYGLKHLRDEDRARELVQAVLVAMIEALRSGRVEDPERFDRFVLGTCRNLTARARHAAARAVPIEPANLDLDLDLASVTPTHANLDVAALMNCIAQLEARARTVLHMSFYHDKTADEIAAVLETSAGNVRVVRHRAVAQLRACMGEAP